MKAKKCKHCGKTFVPRTTGDVYCNECRYPDIKCSKCGKKIAKLTIRQIKRYWKEGTSGSYFCSERCRLSSNNLLLKKRSVIEKECAKCGKKFITWADNQLWCDDCHNVRIECNECHKIFVPNRSQVVRYLNNNGEGLYFCSKKCVDINEQKKQNAKDTYKNKTGYENNMQNPEGIKFWKQKFIDKYGVDHPSKLPDHREKAKATTTEKYGVPNILQLDKYKENIAQARAKYQREHGGRSSSEVKFQRLLEKCGFIEGKDFITEYKSDEYPYHCDFFLIPKNIYIEINVYYTHGKHWYNKNNSSDIAQLQKWNNAKKEHKQYQSAIKTWTESDVKKREIAKKNKLNYVVLWNNTDIEDWFRLGMPVGQDWKYEYTWKK